ncbi:hypothetical protein [Serratia sp. JSRIV004]|uniref:hypothetical protein n=1 Tax=Serratia sp. JSRIV004 TaxID=2831895 RepID=UPI001CBB87B3|nr:hypothetical protein [Serratia sp. JSRIV004]UAN59598.1 hypothetical protein KGP21_11340 [Serratia sp. JSRIV004]
MSELTKAEKAWIAEVQAVLNKCPSKRIGFYTIGDPQVYLWDMDKKKNVFGHKGDFSPAVENAGAGFELHLNFPAPVESVSA